MNNQELQSIIEGLQEEGHTQKDIVQIVNRYCEEKDNNFRLSESTFSRIINKDIDSLKGNKAHILLRILKEMQTESQAFAPINVNSDLAHLLGCYEVYHKTKHGGNILCNILEIQADGKAVIKTVSNNVHLGEVKIFQHSMVAINFYTIDEQAFYYQLLFNLKGYLHYGLENVHHFWGISTTVSLEELPMANLRLFFPIIDKIKAQPLNIGLETDAFKDLQIQKPALKIFNSKQDTRLLCPYEINEIPEIS